MHEQSYGHQSPEETIQIVNLRIIASRITNNPQLKLIKSLSKSKAANSNEERAVWLSSGKCHLSIYRREMLSAGHYVKGPAIIEETESTTLIGENWSLEVDKLGNFIIES